MKDLEQLVENYFPPEKKGFLFESLLKLVESEMLVFEEQEQITSQPETKKLPIPRPVLSEKWGLPGSTDRANIEKFFKNIAPGGDLQAKIAQIESFILDCDERCVSEQNIAEILANLVFLDTLSAIVFDYNANVAGFLFEAFLAALLFGRQEVAAGNKTIEDILDKDDVPISLKLLGVGRELKGSRKLLQNTFEKWGEIRYVVGSKLSKKELDIAFYEIVVTPENYHELDISSSKTQFVIPARSYQENQIGEINLGSREQIKSIAQRYTERLGDNLFTIYELLENLSNNINQYFLEDNKQAGEQAHSDATNLQNNIKTLID